MWSRKHYFSRFVFDSPVWILHCFQLLVFMVAILMPNGCFFSSLKKKTFHSTLYWDLSEGPKAWNHNPWHLKSRYCFNRETKEMTCSESPQCNYLPQCIPVAWLVQTAQWNTDLRCNVFQDVVSTWEYWDNLQCNFPSWPNRELKRNWNSCPHPRSGHTYVEGGL